MNYLYRMQFMFLNNTQHQIVIIKFHEIQHFSSRFPPFISKTLLKTFEEFVILCEIENGYGIESPFF